jgi:N-acetyl-anhydromuramyl-L-alanine amidase AmpD
VLKKLLNPFDFQTVNSINWGDRYHKINGVMVDTISMIVIHYTEKSKQRTLEIFNDPQCDTSAHYVIDMNGDVIQCVDDNKRAHHAGPAGKTSWKNEHDINTASIGIELINYGYQWPDDASIQNGRYINAHYVSGWRDPWHAYPQPQIESLIIVIKHLMKQHSIAPHMIVGHSDVHPYHKTDPGPLFPWQHLYDNGIGMGMDDNEKLPIIIPQCDIMDECLEKLHSIGYGLPSSNDPHFNMKCRYLIQTFQMHFRQSHISGDLDAETIHLIQLLEQKYGHD